MKLQLKTVSLFAFAIASAVVIGDVSVASAEPGASDPAQTPTSFTPPPPLTGAQKFQLANKALTSAGLPILTVTLPPAQMKVTVAAPTNNGASITKMGPGAWLGASAYSPDGAFQLAPKQVAPGGTDYYPAHVDIRFPAEVGKYYLVDCKVTNMATAGQQVQFWGLSTSNPLGTGPKSQVAVEGGHVLYSLQAQRTNEGVSVGTLNNNYFSFHGCEITKIN